MVQLARQLVIIVNLTRFRVTRETEAHLWVCLQRHFQGGLVGRERRTLNVGDIILWPRSKGGRKRKPAKLWLTFLACHSVSTLLFPRPPCQGEPPPLKPRVQHIFSLFTCFFMVFGHSNETVNKYALCWSRIQIQAHLSLKPVTLTISPCFVKKQNKTTTATTKLWY